MHGPIMPVAESGIGVGISAGVPLYVQYSKLTPPLILASNSYWNKIKTYSTNLQIIMYIGFQILLESTQSLIVQVM